MNRSALIIVDVQNDFLPGGALAVPGGDEIVPAVNGLMDKFDHVVATQDWHPADHGSFASNHQGGVVGEVIELNGLAQVLWPDHCVQGSVGAELASALDVDRIENFFKKGTDSEIDSYSGFFDNGKKKATGLGEWLKEIGVTKVTVVGLATDYCVKFTGLNALEEGFDVTLIKDACRGVNLAEGDVSNSIRELEEAGCRIV